MKPNFRNPKTGEEFFYAKHTTVYKDNGDIINKDRWGKQIVDPKDGTPLELIPKSIEGGAPLIGTSRENIGKILKKRSKEHNKKGEIRDRREALNRDTKYIKETLGGGGITTG